MEFLTTDVLVIGGGIAGMRAALAARACKVEVTLISRRKAGKSGSSLVANTGHRIFGHDVNSGEAFIAQTLNSGQGLADKELVEILAAESFDAVNQLKKWGVPLEFEYKDGFPQYARCYEWKGLLITENLRTRCEESGMQIFDDYTALQLIKSNGRVVGVYAASNDNIDCFLAKTVILATGGVGQLYRPTDNPVDISGTGYSLAWEAGAELMDMEFVQFYPYQLKSPFSEDLHISVFELGAQLINEQGDRFMAGYPEKELVTRDVLSQEMFLQQGNIYLDLMDVELDTLKKINPRLVELFLQDVELIVSPIQHFFMGGVKMDKAGRSTLPGLYVCGEVAAGVHGANRLGGNALTECSVFGRIAGDAAAKEAAGLDLNPAGLDQTSLRQGFYSPREGYEQCLPVRNGLGSLMWENVGIIRDGEKMHCAQREIRHQLSELEQLKPRSITEWYETRHMLRTACLITEAAIKREESRGAHYRLDFPETDAEWDGRHVVLTKEGIRFAWNERK